MITTMFELLLYWQMTYISSSIILRVEYHVKEIIETLIIHTDSND